MRIKLGNTVLSIYRLRDRHPRDVKGYGILCNQRKRYITGVLREGIQNKHRMPLGSRRMRQECDETISIVDIVV